MKFLTYTLLAIILAFGLQHIGPWWTIAVATLIVGFIGKELSPAKAWFMGALAIFTLWLVWSLYSDAMNDGILSNKVGNLLGGLSGTLLALVTSVIGGIVGGLAGLTGRLLRSSMLEGGKTPAPSGAGE